MTGFRIAPLKVSGPIPKKIVREEKPDAEKDPAHLAFIRTLPCLASGRESGVIAHHLRMGRFAMSKKSPDSASVPLHTVLHEGSPQSLHSMSEYAFWSALGINAVQIAKILWENTGDYHRCRAEIAAERAAGKIRRAFGVELYPEKSAGLRQGSAD